MLGCAITVRVASGHVALILAMSGQLNMASPSASFRMTQIVGVMIGLAGSYKEHPGGFQVMGVE